KLSQPTINDVVHEYYKALKAGVEARAGGRIKLEIYPANQLGQLPAVVEGVALGTIEAGSAANGFWVSLEPRFQVLDAPGLFDDVLHGNKVVNDPAIRNRLATFGADKGVEILAPGVYSPMMLLTHKGVRTIADFQGQKVRTQGGAPIQVEPFKKLGVLPVSLPLGEALPAMQNRTIDGMIAGVAPFTAFKYYDIAKPMTYLPSTTLVAPILVNRQFMKSLGPDLEAIVREEGRKAEVLFADWNVADIKRAEEVWRKNGGELITLAPAEAKRYLDVVAPVATSVLSVNPKVKNDYEALLAAARKNLPNNVKAVVSPAGRRRAPQYCCRAHDAAGRRQAGGADRCAGACRQRKNRGRNSYEWAQARRCRPRWNRRVTEIRSGHGAAGRQQGNRATDQGTGQRRIRRAGQRRIHRAGEGSGICHGRRWIAEAGRRDRAERTRDRQWRDDRW